MRFYCHTDGHSRKIHFLTTNSTVRDDALNGTPNAGANSWSAGVTLLTGHTANLPAATNSSHGGATEGLLAYPFYKSSTYHWSVRGNGDRWECDDRVLNDVRETLHQIWWR